MLFKLKKITADYYGVLSKLRRLRELADTLGEIGTDLRKDAERAENQCKDCIHRFNNVNESLKDRTTVIYIIRCFSWRDRRRYLRNRLERLTKMRKI